MIKIDVQCYHCKSITNPVEIDDTCIGDDSTEECKYIRDKQRECANCGKKWDEIELHYNSYNQFEFAYGK